MVNTPNKVDIDRVFWIAFTSHSLVRALNCTLKKRGIEEISVGIGMDWAAHS